MQATDAIEKAVIEASASLIEVISEISALKDERERIEPKGVEDFDNIKDNLINASLDIAHAISLMEK